MNHQLGILDKKVLRVYPEWSEKCKWIQHIPKFWFYDSSNKKTQYECLLCGLHLNAYDRLDKIFGRVTPIGVLHV